MTVILCERKDCIYCDMRSKTCQAEQVEIDPRARQCYTWERREEEGDASEVLPVS